MRRTLEAFHHHALSVSLPQLAHLIGCPAVAAPLQAWGQRRIRRIEIIFSGNAHEREKGIPPRIGEGGSHALCRGDVADLAYRPFRGEPFPGRMRKNGREAKKAGLFIDARCLDRRDLMPAKALAHDVQPARQRGIAEGAVRLPGKGDRMVATSDFSGLVSSTWALARAAAMVAIVSLERCMAAALRAQDIKAHGA